MIEVILEILAELLLQIFAEMLVELGLYSLKEPFRRRPNRWVASLGYATVGALLGLFSMVFFPTLLVDGEVFRWLNLLVTPLVAGAAMAALGAWRMKRGQTALRLDTFVYGYLFALSMALVRFALGS